MDYVTVRELREKSGEVWQRVEAGEEFVITRNGKPVAVVVGTAPHEVEGRLRALRAAQLGEVVERLQLQALANGTNGLTDAEIQTEINAARQQRQEAVVATEPDRQAKSSSKTGRASHARRR